VLEFDGNVVAQGGILFHYNRSYGDIYMEVAGPFRRRGLGSYFVQELKRAAYDLGSVPCARCNTTNIPSRRTAKAWIYSFRAHPHGCHSRRRSSLSRCNAVRAAAKDLGCPSIWWIADCICNDGIWWCVSHSAWRGERTFRDPQSPWQRGPNENTNLLLWQYLPRGTDLSAYSQAQLDQVSLRLNQTMTVPSKAVLPVPAAVPRRPTDGQ
jgi:hypothetical protein